MKSRRVKQAEAFLIFFKETYNSAQLAGKLVRQIRQRWMLRENFKRARKITRLQEAHHIIPVEAVMQSRLVQKAMLKGFEVNGIKNGIALSIAQHKRVHKEMANYNRFVLQELLNLEAKFPSCTREKAKKEVDKLVKFLEQQFLSP